MKHLMRFWMLTALLAVAVPSEADQGATGPGESASGHAEHGDAALNFFDFSSETSHPLVALLINFVLLLIIVYLLLKKPLGKKFKDRKEALENALKEARDTKALAEKAIEEARAKMASVDEALKRVREEILTAGKSESEKIIDEAERRSRQLLSDTEALVAHEVHRIAGAIKEEAVLKIVERAERAIREKISKADHEMLHSDLVRVNEGKRIFGGAIGLEDMRFCVMDAKEVKRPLIAY